MLQALKVEWMKIKNYRTFWVLLAITVVSIPAFNYTFYNVMNNSFPKGPGRMLLGSPYAFPDVWQTVSWNATLLFLVPAILIITLTTNEFVFKTHRQNVIDGWSRGQFVSIKLLQVLILTVICTLVVVLTALGFGFIGNKPPAGISAWQDSRFIFFFFVQMLSYSVIAFLLSMLIKRAGLAIGAFLIYMLLENVVAGIGKHQYHVKWVNYLPEEVTDQLIPQPYLKSFLSKQDVIADWEHHIPIYLTVSLVYLIIYCLFISRRFLKSDL